MFTLDKVVMAIIKQASRSCDSATGSILTFAPSPGPNDRGGYQVSGTVGVVAVDAEAGEYDDPRRDWLPARSRATRWIRRESVSI